jgi:hypothetical protein
MVKKRLKKKDFYLEVLSEFKLDTNLGRIKNKLLISKQNLQYYITKLTRLGYLENKDLGWYEVTEKGKNPTKYGKPDEEDFVRGHAYVWNVSLEKIPGTWDERISILKKLGIPCKLVGALKSTPRIKVLGRKVWLCNTHIRIFDKEKASYYGEDAKESQMNGKVQAFRILRTLERKLGIKLCCERLKFQKEHYAIIKNDLAKHHNEQGIICRISDEGGEWLLIDDSLEGGGELETVGKKAFQTNPRVQDWWNDHKKNNFEVTSSYVQNNFNNLISSQKSQTERMDELMLVTSALIKEIQKLKNKQN